MRDYNKDPFTMPVEELSAEFELIYREVWRTVFDDPDLAETDNDNDRRDTIKHIVDIYFDESKDFNDVFNAAFRRDPELVEAVKKYDGDWEAYILDELDYNYCRSGR